MDVTLHINGDTEAVLLQQAARTGRDVASLVLETLEDSLLPDDQERATADPHTRVQAFREWVAAMPSGNVDADLSRESVYDDRGL